MIDEVTTNKTDFFREPAHFDFLLREVLPVMSDAGVGTGAQRELIVWSAACSTGEEVYTLAMVLADAGSRQARPFIKQPHTLHTLEHRELPARGRALVADEPEAQRFSRGSTSKSS